MKRKSQTERWVPGPNIVRAWFDTVINPILAGLETEQRLLIERNWTWQFRPGGLESIRPILAWVRLGVHVDASPNLEQFLTLHSSLGRQINDHDRAVQTLNEACSRCHKTFVLSPELMAAYHKALSPESVARLIAKSPLRHGTVQLELSVKSAIEEFFGAYPPTDHLALLAQYVLNQTGELPDYFTPAPLWNEYRLLFLAVLGAPGIRSVYKAVMVAGEKVRKINDVLIRGLKETRLKLSLEHDVPYVNAQENVETAGPWPR